jgi:hypothetical protein
MCIVNSYREYFLGPRNSFQGVRIPRAGVDCIASVAISSSTLATHIVALQPHTATAALLTSSHVGRSTAWPLMGGSISYQSQKYSSSPVWSTSWSLEGRPGPPPLELPLAFSRSSSICPWARPASQCSITPLRLTIRRQRLHVDEGRTVILHGHALSLYGSCYMYSAYKRKWCGRK